MTDKELQDLISLKKYEQPEDGYFDDFLVEFQQRQRSEILNTSARGLFLERLRARFSEFGTMRWVVGAGVAYATVALAIQFIPNNDEVAEPAMASTLSEKEYDKSEVSSETMVDKTKVGQDQPVSMVFIEPVDFSTPAPAFSAEERIF